MFADRQVTPWNFRKCSASPSCRASQDSVCFSVLLLMGLGLAIIFGQMGVINMAHGEFMTIGAYTVFLFPH